jgi:hypothetical protein
MNRTRVVLWGIALASFGWFSLPLFTGNVGDLPPKNLIAILSVLVVFCPVIAEVLKIRQKKCN